MSNEAIDLARQKKLPFRVNRGQEIDFTISVNNSDGTPYDFTDHTAEMYVYKSYNKTESPLYTITVTLSLGQIRFTSDAIDSKKEDLVYRLWITDDNDYRQPWTNGPFLVLDSEVDHEDGEDTIIISPNGDDITLTISPVGGGSGSMTGAEILTALGAQTANTVLAGPTNGAAAAPSFRALVAADIPSSISREAWELETFATELTFDNKKHLTTISGGTRTFTLAASGHLNGVEIIARIDKPTAVNFPVDFEAINGSDEIQTDLMNIIRFTYFEDYDGDGNGKVLYEIKNQASTVVDFMLLEDGSSKIFLEDGSSYILME